MSSGRSLPQINISVHGGIQGDSHKIRARTGERVMSKNSSYNPRRRSGRRVDSRPTMEMKTQLGGPVRARKSKGRNYSPYIEEQTRSGNKNTRRRGNQQQKDQESNEVISTTDQHYNRMETSSKTQGYKTTPLRVKRDSEDVSSELDNGD
ncbi:hypothetical protein TNCV_1748311 [Trichonephila clavipes]|nr:hypothetical protein TNCV_1748311 [Trichonephila clavipes]